MTRSEFPRKEAKYQKGTLRYLQVIQVFIFFVKVMWFFGSFNFDLQVGAES